MNKIVLTFGICCLALCTTFCNGCGSSAKSDSSAYEKEGKKADLVTVDVPNEPGFESAQDQKQTQIQDQKQEQKKDQKQEQTQKI